MDRFSFFLHGTLYCPAALSDGLCEGYARLTRPRSRGVRGLYEPHGVRLRAPGHLLLVASAEIVVDCSYVRAVKATLPDRRREARPVILRYGGDSASAPGCMCDGAGTRCCCSLWHDDNPISCLLYTSPSPRDKRQSRMPSSA